MKSKSKVIFDPVAHTYTAPDGSILSGVTPIVAWMYPHTYDGISEDVLQRAAEYGTMVHKACEAADNGIAAADDFVADYLRIKAEAGLTTKANEYLIDDGRVASSIDVVAEDEQGGTWLLDIKTTSTLHRDMVRLQLSIYAAIAELQGIHATNIAAMWLPKPQYGKPALVPFSIIPAEVCASIIDAYLRKDEQAREVLRGELVETLPAEVLDAEAALCTIIRQQNEMAEQRKHIEAGLLELMHKYNVKKWETDHVVITRVLPSTRRTFDSKALKADQPVLYAMYEKETQTKESIKITLR